jgi:hypothetical protein
MRWVQISGDPYTIGCRLGELAGDAFANVLGQIGRYREVLQEWGDSEYLGELERAGRATFPRLMREIDGIADGAGVPFGTAFAWNCRGDFPGGGEQTALAGCTDVMGLSRRGAFMAHNEDDQPELDGRCFMVEVQPDEGVGFTSFYSPGLLPGHTFGWNTAGLVQNINHLRTHDQRIGVPRHLLSRAVLGCEDLDDAVALIRETPRAGGFHHNLGMCGESPRVVSVEAPASGVVIGEVRTVHAHTNHLLREELAAVPQTVAQSSSARQDRAAELIAKGLTDDNAALAVVADTRNAKWPILRKRRGSNDPGFTLASAVFALNRDLHWRVYLNPTESPIFQGHQLPDNVQSVDLH